ncbi:MAG: hypothetical protein ACOCYP_05585 [Planctomycetota bacterium]
MAAQRGNTGPPAHVQVHGGSSTAVLIRIARRYRADTHPPVAVLAELGGLEAGPVAEPSLAQLVRDEFARSSIRALALVCPDPALRIALRLQLYLVAQPGGPRIAVFAAVPPARAWLAGPAGGVRQA